MQFKFLWPEEVFGAIYIRQNTGLGMAKTMDH